MKKLILGIVVLVMSGCATAAQRQATYLHENIQLVNQRLTDCLQKISTNPAYQSITTHAPIILTRKVGPTLHQLTDNSVPSDEEIKIIIAIHDEGALCRERAIEDLMKFLPGVVPTLTESFHAGDLIIADLIQRKITWGEANKKRVALMDETAVKLRAADAQIARELAASHQAELEQRRAAINALSQWSYQQQVLWQNQQLINSMNRPVITNCTTGGGSFNCISR